MAPPLENSRTWRAMVFLSQRINQWEFILACGMLMIGLQGGVWLRQTGLKLLSLPLTGILMPMLVYGLMGHLLATQIHPPPLMDGCHRNWTQQIRTGSNGCKKITWSTTTAQTIKGFLRASLQNAASHREDSPINTQILLLFVFLHSLILCLWYSFFCI